MADVTETKLSAINSKSHLRGRLVALATALILASKLADASILITKRVTVQPIQIRGANSSECANCSLDIYEAEADKIWSQAGIDVRYLPTVFYTNNSYLNVSSDAFANNSFLSLALNPGHAQHPDEKVINLWFVRAIDNSSSTYGFSLQTTLRGGGSLLERNGVSIANSAFAYGGGLGMRDIFAYEMARNLGLDNGTLGAQTDPKNLMKPSGPYPTSIDDIYPDGAAYGHLTAEQIQMAQRVSFSVDLPPEHQFTYPPVLLYLQQENQRYLLSWSDTNYVLETKTSFMEPWLISTNQANPQTILFEGPQQFYQLRKAVGNPVP